MIIIDRQQISTVTCVLMPLQLEAILSKEIYKALIPYTRRQSYQVYQPLRLYLVIILIMP